ncbi:MAG: YncE family protein [Nannocystales bacterium]
MLSEAMRLGLKLCGLVICAAAGCSDDGVVTADVESGANTSGLGTDGNGASASDSDPTSPPTGVTDASTGGLPGGSDGSGDDPTEDTGPQSGVLPEPVPRSGVAYVAHFLGGELRWYRTDADVPTAGGSLDLGTITHDLALDDVNDRLVVAQDVAQRVVLYGLDRPDGPGDAVEDPQELGALQLETAPRFVRVDPYHERLYVVADDTTGGTGMMLLHTVDTTDPAKPAVLSSVTIPATTSLDVDGPRRILVLFHGITDEVFTYDVSAQEPAQLGEPIDLREPYPEENSTAFSARTLTLDPWHARLYAARSQSAFSELIVMTYPDALPSDGESYGDVAEFALEAVADPFDLSVDISERPGILDAFTPLPSPTDFMVFLTAGAWNGTLPSGTLVTMSDGGGEGPLTLEPGCEEHEGFGCFIQDYTGGAPIAFLQTDGAACRDWTHGVVVTTGLATPEGDPGQVVFFEYENDGTTAPWLADGGNLPAAAFPVAAVCH